MLKNEFDELAQRLGSPFAAVNYVAKAARNKIKCTDYPVSEPDAISWVLTGVEPENRQSVHNSNFNIPLLDDMLSEVDDEEVCYSVRESYRQSLDEHHLIYCYHISLDEGRKGRVRILTKMIWYNIKSEGGLP